MQKTSVKKAESVATKRQIARVEKNVEKSTKKTIKISPVDRVHDALIKGAIDNDLSIKLTALIEQQGYSYIEAMRELRHVSIDLEYKDGDKVKMVHYYLKATFIASRDAFVLTNVSPIGNTVAVVAPLADGTGFVKVYGLAVKPTASSLYKSEYIDLIEDAVCERVYALKGADYMTLKSVFLAIRANGSKDVTWIDTPVKPRELAIDNAIVKGLAKRDSVNAKNAKKSA